MRYFVLLLGIDSCVVIRTYKYDLPGTVDDS